MAIFNLARHEQEAAEMRARLLERRRIRTREEQQRRTKIAARFMRIMKQAKMPMTAARVKGNGVLPCVVVPVERFDEVLRLAAGSGKVLRTPIRWDFHPGADGAEGAMVKVWPDLSYPGHPDMAGEPTAGV